MAKTLIVFILLLLTIQIYGQQRKIKKNKKDNIIQKIEEINSLLNYYGTLSPFSENENQFELIDSINNSITTLLLKILNDNRITNYPIETLLNQNEIFISKSNDNRVFLFSLDNKTGGSYRPSTTIIHYRLSNGTVKANIFEGEASEIIATSSYNQIFLLDSINNKYFAIGGVQTCNTCIASVAITIQLDSCSYKIDLIANYDGRYYDLIAFEFDSIEKVFFYEYYSADNGDSLYESNNVNDQFRLKHKSKFKFIDGEFFEIEKCVFLVKRE